MKRVQIVPDKELLKAANPETRRTSQNLSVLEREAQDREGYLKTPQSPAESRALDAETAWPEE